MSVIIVNIATITETMAPIIVSKTAAIAEMIELMAEPMVETTEPIVNVSVDRLISGISVESLEQKKYRGELILSFSWRLTALIRSPAMW